MGHIYRTGILKNFEDKPLAQLAFHRMLTCRHISSCSRATVSVGTGRAYVLTSKDLHTSTVEYQIELI